MSVALQGNQSPTVPSRKYFNDAAMFPKLLGLPMTSPAHSSRSVFVAYGGPELGTASSTASVTAETCGTVRKRADIPSIESTPLHTSRARASVAPLRE